LAERSLPRESPHSEAGFSLPEVLITIVIVAITFTAILGGMITSISVSALHRKQATADTVGRDAAEWIKDSLNNPYAPCAGPNKYTFTGLSVPSGFSVSVQSVQYWNGVAPVGTPTYAPYAPAFVSVCPATDQGIQRITIVASSSDGQDTERVQILKRPVP
jgi:prepilin-type N-terminal cleavage/methylation domain-containing protein